MTGTNKVVIRYTPGKGYVYVTTTPGDSPPTVKLPDGTTMTAVRADKVGGSFENKNEYGPGGPTQYQWVFPDLPKYDGADVTFSYGGQSKSVKLNAGTEYRSETGGLAGVDAAPNKAGSGPALGGAPGGLNPSQFGAGYLPQFLGGQIPQFQPISYQPINTPNYQMFDPAKYSQKYGNVIRNDILKNFQEGKGLALDTLNTELTGLRKFVPQAAEIARTEAAIDNIQNQQQRTNQLNRVLPDVVGGLKTQTADAATYATGRLPNSIDDAALEYGIRSRAADNTAARGFGDNSLVGKNTSDLMSAEERFQIAQYGNTLKDQNAQTRSALELAPTEYINAGQQVKVTPSVDAGQYASKYLSEINGLGTIPATAALQAAIQQSQFKTNTGLDVSKFNATNTLNTNMYNASNTYSSQLNAFNYLTGFAQQAADLGTAQMNQNREDTQRDALTKLFQEGQSKAQNAKTVQSILGALGVAPSLIKQVLGAFGVTGDSSGGGSDLLSQGDTLNYDQFNTPDYNKGGYYYDPTTGDYGYDPNVNTFPDTGNFNIPDEFGPQYGIDYSRFLEAIS